MNNAVNDIDWSQLIHAHRVHGSLYHDEAIFAQELARIWYRGWVYVGHQSEIPNPHDFVMKSIGPQPVLMTRDGAGQIHLLLNRCPHRGNEVCVEPRGNRRSFVCPFHAWSFGSDGTLHSVAFPDGYAEIDRNALGLGRVARVAAYGGFVFGSFATEGPSLLDYLGAAAETIDRLLAFSPAGEVELTTGFLQHRVKANWKFVLENETDGYHPAFVHSSIFGVTDSGLAKLYGANSLAVSRDLGNGHSELDLRPEFRRLGQPLGWFGTSSERYPDYVASMARAHGDQSARQILIDGTPHVMIFPNLFIAEIQIFVLQPRAVDDTVQHVTALQFKGAPELNRRLRQQTMGSVGPAGLLLADDSVMYERTQRGVQARDPQWLYLGRGLHRERRDEQGFVIGDASDEVPSRGIWRHYRQLMETGS